MTDYLIGEGSNDAIEYVIGWPALTSWINRHISKANLIVRNLSTALRDGVILCTLCEILAKPLILKQMKSFDWLKRPTTKVEALRNVTAAIDALFAISVLPQQTHSIITSTAIFEGDMAATVLLVSCIIWHFRLEKFHIAAEKTQIGDKDEQVKAHKIPPSSLEEQITPFEEGASYVKHNVIAYTTNISAQAATEGNCRRLLTLLESKGVRFEEKNLSVLEAYEKFAELEEIKMKLKNYDGVGAGTLPLLEIDGEIIGDYELVQDLEDHEALDDYVVSARDTHPLFQSEKLEEMSDDEKYCRIVGWPIPSYQLMVTGDAVDANWGKVQYQWFQIDNVASNSNNNINASASNSSIISNSVSASTISSSNSNNINNNNNNNNNNGGGGGGGGGGGKRSYLQGKVDHILAIPDNLATGTILECEVRMSGNKIAVARSKPIELLGPRISRIGLSGGPSFSKPIEVVYKYIGDAEGNTVIQWYRGGGENELYPIPGANSRIYYPTIDDYKSTWLCVEITPFRFDGVFGLTTRGWVPQNWLSMDDKFKAAVTDFVLHGEALIPVSHVLPDKKLETDRFILCREKNIKFQRSGKKTLSKCGWRDPSLSWELVPMSDKRVKFTIPKETFQVELPSSKDRDTLILVLQTFQNIHMKAFNN